MATRGECLKIAERIELLRMPGLIKSGQQRSRELFMEFYDTFRVRN
jgi:hypothetical protein